MPNMPQFKSVHVCGHHVRTAPCYLLSYSATCNSRSYCCISLILCCLVSKTVTELETQFEFRPAFLEIFIKGKKKRQIIANLYWNLNVMI